jgi:hypothetical protein
MTKRARVSGLYLEVLLRVLLSRKTSLHLGAPLAEGEIPSDWRDAHIVPVFKKGEKHLPSNYRAL